MVEVLKQCNEVTNLEQEIGNHLQRSRKDLHPLLEITSLCHIS